ncbi:hypothetical protein [Thalassospira sp.]|uniref:hypothetical protein n=1 Tax=Thalassospira sp. TaxID=1912094 RepID=UPI00261B16C2|nr:hypothetical protein [Thalassospira sp.]MCH2276769.1 hypothetical protein [Thalassospira sp.]
MTRHHNDPIDDAIDEVESSNTLKRIVFVVALICLASSLAGLFFLVTRLILPRGFF